MELAVDASAKSLLGTLDLAAVFGPVFATVLRLVFDFSMAS
jgi:hypothetical protein